MGYVYKSIVPGLCVLTMVDIDEYLPRQTLSWCHVTLQKCGFDLQSITGAAVTQSGERVHQRAYLFLKDAATQYVASGVEPRLMECVKPRGAYEWMPELV